MLSKTQTDDLISEMEPIGVPHADGKNKLTTKRQSAIFQFIMSDLLSSILLGTRIR